MINGTWWCLVSIGQYWLVCGSNGSVWGGVGWYLVFFIDPRANGYISYKAGQGFPLSGSYRLPYTKVNVCIQTKKITRLEYFSSTESFVSWSSPSSWVRSCWPDRNASQLPREEWTSGMVGSRHVDFAGSTCVIYAPRNKKQFKSIYRC